MAEHVSLYLRRLARMGFGDGVGIQFASFIKASSLRFAAIVENCARLSGVILFMVENARAAFSIPFFRCKPADSYLFRNVITSN